MTTTAKPTYIQHVALGKLLTGTGYGHPIAATTLRVLEREGWVRDGKVTDAGRAAHSRAMAPSPESDKCPRCVYGEPTDHTCDEGQQHRYRVEHHGQI